MVMPRNRFMIESLAIERREGFLIFQVKRTLAGAMVIADKVRKLVVIARIGDCRRREWEQSQMLLVVIFKQLVEFPRFGG